MTEPFSNQVASAANGVDYTYRDIGSGGSAPLVLLQHFRGNLDNWDPALIDALASRRRVITFNNVGVASTTGATPNTIEEMARDAIVFLTALGLDQADVLGFSIGSFVAQEIALDAAGARAQARSGIRRSEGSGGDARVGAGSHRGCRQTRG